MNYFSFDRRKQVSSENKKMTTSFQSGKNIQEGQSPAEQRFCLNLMINVMSQSTDKHQRSKLDLNVHKIAEVL